MKSDDDDDDTELGVDNNELWDWQLRSSTVSTYNINNVRLKEREKI